MLAGCSNGTNSVFGGDPNSLEGTYYNKDQRATMVLKKANDDSYSMDVEDLVGASKGRIYNRASDQDVAEYFKDFEDRIKPGQYFLEKRTEESGCPHMLVHYENDTDVYRVNCILMTGQFVKQ
ncbi:conserved hypothetical protein [Ricinus communis]|uniref:Uncharacterized protein n=1 Tax=Ricinus communis TaxID=3988 RepID=B9TKQ1_RICCO|nr:conserved hypothetical protein [Ricinus communis]